ncbi:FtsK/SpoIIIE domain-containing protein [Microcella daejeonensis]|uniref:FtsK/SpoIIIE domain-containing protein n=1 Tax=Microcella daejeonensis TaxID=2994971 RepID=A0A9E8MK00_9MICO|nr:FtsK/SpoIIIE domain-containing protein [Microcella daejeonensis]WAB80970.1 FtsK/SpoIIIE domain-containing protein [Microcella daejeonensis]
MPFPLIAVIAPLLGAVVIGLLVRSPFVLVFAVLSPLIALATMADGRRQARRHRREERERFEREVVEYEREIERAHAAERLEVDRALPPPWAAGAGSPGAPHLPVRIGVAPRPSRCAPDAPRALPADADGDRLRALHERAAVHPWLPVGLPPGPVVVEGRGTAADNLRRLVTAAPGTTLVTGPSEAASAVTVRSATSARLQVPGAIGIDLRLEPVTALEIELIRPVEAESALPSSVRVAELPSPSPQRPGRIPIGVGVEGPVHLDLVADGPHALIGGTTGSGKSELLRTLVLGWASAAAPREHSVLLVDFKGGAAFTGLAALPHVVGLMTDLAPEAAERALRSLRAELRRRERLLLEHGCRDIAELPRGVLSRMLVVVDEYAALVESVEELPALFADLSARGRSLGIHLVLCTQRPAGVVRDAVLANCSIRILFRVTAASDSRALLGAPAAGIEAAPIGRAVVAAGGGSAVVQIARIEEGDIVVVADRHRAAPAPDRPWLEALPAVIPMPLDEAGGSRGDRVLPAGAASLDEGGGWAFGVLDQPDEQRRAIARWDPRRDGALLVVGATGSGRSRALGALAFSAAGGGAPVTVLPIEPAAAWAVLGAIVDGRPIAPPREAAGGDPAGLLLIDDLDALLAAAGDATPALLDRLDGAIRILRARGGGLAASVRALTGLPASAASRFDSVLLMRAASLEEHRLAGGAGPWNRDAPPGRGRWHGTLVQVGLSPVPLPEPAADPIEEWTPPAAPIAVVTARPRAVLARLAESGISASSDPGALAAATVDLEHPAVRARAAAVVAADAETWQSAWGALSAARREGAIVLADVTEAEVRLLLGHRTAPPPRRLGASAEVWIAEAGEPLRRARWSALGAAAAPEH